MSYLLLEEKERLFTLNFASQYLDFQVVFKIQSQALVVLVLRRQVSVNNESRSRVGIKGRNQK